MPQKKVLIGLMLGCFFLVGTGSAMAALWDQSCRVAIDNLQRLQEKVALKKQEIDVARMVEAIPADFVSGQLKTSLRPIKGTSQLVNELKGLFQNGEFAVKKFSQMGLMRNGVSQ